ncbi:hypothetical protein [Mucilaginibacter lacusdianchii]|uniref:hypothetical protein n=1 Tax=Mucilaginibacter lacusdianchii TaxID=2684211 RepID=UPI00131B8FFB|nr:hypothetical protein [Mucilaginibacter sp. JXJ CY 39]
MFKNKFKLGAIAATALVMTFSACKKDKEEAPEADENELITKVSFKFTNAANAADVATVTWSDPDGEGGVAPTIGTLNLKPNTTYNFEVSEVLNETAKDPDERNILNEINEESYEHLWVYKPVAASIMTVTRTDKDKNNFEIGLKGTAKTGAAATGTLQTILRHQPGEKNGTEAPGSSDFDATFPVRIQ